MLIRFKYFEHLRSPKLLINYYEYLITEKLVKHRKTEKLIILDSSNFPGKTIENPSTSIITRSGKSNN